MKRCALALVITLISLSPALSDEYFIQMWTSNHKAEKVFIEEGDDPGGIEVLGPNGEFVACQEATAIKDWNSDTLSSFSAGFVSKFPLKDLKFMPRGAIKTKVKVLTKETLIPVVPEGK